MPSVALPVGVVDEVVALEVPVRFRRRGRGPFRLGHTKRTAERGKLLMTEMSENAAAAVIKLKLLLTSSQLQRLRVVGP